MIQSILDFVLKLVGMFNNYAKDYQFVAGVLSLWGLGTLSYLLKDIPRKIWAIIKKFSTTTVTLTSSNDSFYLFLKWYEDRGYAKKGRYIKISNGRWGEDDMIKSIGYGNHYFWYQWRLILLIMQQKASVGTDRDRDELTMVLVGRSHKILDSIFKEVMKKQDNTNKFIIKKFNKSYWQRSSEQKPRIMDTIFLQQGVKEKILSHLDKFIEMEEWYLDKGIPYQTGIILYGPPGTGKTSIIKAVANYLNYQMHILGSSSLSGIENAMFNLSEKSLLCIEDIDTDPVTRSRDKPVLKKKKKKLNKNVSAVKTIDEEAEKTEEPNDPKEVVIDFSFANLSDILNAIDGVQSVHGRILILTTNHIDKLDSALLRPGRIDLRLEIGYVDEYVLNQFFERFYPPITIPEDFKIKQGISSAQVQNLILENLNNPLNVLKNLRRN